MLKKKRNKKNMSMLQQLSVCFVLLLPSLAFLALLSSTLSLSLSARGVCGFYLGYMTELSPVSTWIGLAWLGFASLALASPAPGQLFDCLTG